MLTCEVLFSGLNRRVLFTPMSVRTIVQMFSVSILPLDRLQGILHVPNEHSLSTVCVAHGQLAHLMLSTNTVKIVYR